jgi:hypothetical protein
MITDPKHVDEIYAKLLSDKLKVIEQRDKIVCGTIRLNTAFTVGACIASAGYAHSQRRPLHEYAAVSPRYLL